MFKFIATYSGPENDKVKASFDQHFKNVNEPICFKIPRIKELLTNKMFGGPTGQSNFYLITEMMEPGKDAMEFAGDLASIHFTDEKVIKK
jgi:hypothetical protein